MEFHTEHARGYVHSVNHCGDQERHHAKRIGQQVLSISDLAEVPKQRGIQDKSGDETWTIDTRDRRGTHMKQPIKDSSDEMPVAKDSFVAGR